MGQFGIGQAVRRVEDERFITGAGKFSDDVQPAGLKFLALARSPHAHAKLTQIDTAEAASMPGVHAVYTGKDWVDRGFNPLAIRTQLKNIDGTDLFVPKRWPLAIDQVRHVGDCVAAVVADTALQAKEAAEAILVDYEILPSVTTPQMAMKSEMIALHDERPDNICMDWHEGDPQKIEDCLSNAAHVVSCSIVNNRVFAGPMEPRGAVAMPAEGGKTEFTGSIQNIFTYRDLICQALNMSIDNMRAYADDIGGGFGAKNQIQPEHVLLVLASRDLNCPVKWISERSEGFVTDSHGRAIETDVRLALDEDLKFIGLFAHSVADIGAYCSTNGPLIPTAATAAVFGGPYKIPTLYLRATGYYTNTAPTDAYRGAGRPEATYMLERIIDKAAKQLGASPIELRRKNLITPEDIPFTNAYSKKIDCGNFPLVLEKTVERADLGKLETRKATSRADGKLRGMGVGYYMESTLGVPNEYAAIDLASDGTATIRVGTQNAGMGHETAFRQIVAEILDLPLEKIGYIHADTAAMPQGGGHGGSRSLQIGGSAVLGASEKMRETLKELASDHLEASVEDIELADGNARVVGTDQSVSIELLAQNAPEPLSENTIYDRENFTFPYGCHIIEVEIDKGTGEITIDRYTVCDDFGNIVNPMIVRGQVIGGIAQGLGQALVEDIIFDEDSGQLLSGSFMDYAMPRADLMPDLENAIEFHEDDPSPSNPMGIKGCGEAGTIAAVPAVVNAVVDALKDYDVDHIDIPMVPEKIWSIIKD